MPGGILVVGFTQLPGLPRLLGEVDCRFVRHQVAEPGPERTSATLHYWWL